MSLAASGSKAKAQNTIIFGSGNRLPASFQRIGHLALFQRRVLGAEAAPPPARRLRMAGAVQVLGVPGRVSSSAKLQHLPALAADAGLQQFVAPLVLARGLAGAGDAGVRFSPPAPAFSSSSAAPSGRAPPPP
jgi:hypothetical protein